MKRTTQDDKTEKVGITLPIVLVKQIEKARRYPSEQIHSKSSGAIYSREGR
jgi:hypothetical protein